MKKNILFLLILTLSLTILNAQESIKLGITAHCSYSKKEIFTITVRSNKLDLSEDAIQDNMGGYVDIPEDSYYLKTDDNVYHLNGVVENSNSNINQFTSYISQDVEKSIKLKELYNLKNSKYLKFIQKIRLEDNNKINETTTNTLYVSFDDELLKKEHQKCIEQMKQSKKTPYLEILFLILFSLGIFYLFLNYFKYKT